MLRVWRCHGTNLAFKVVVTRKEQTTGHGESDRGDAAEHLLIL